MLILSFSISGGAFVLMVSDILSNIRMIKNKAIQHGTAKKNLREKIFPLASRKAVFARAYVFRLLHYP